MIIVIVTKEREKYTGNYREIVSHGIDLDNEDSIVVLPQEPPDWVGAIFNNEVGEYVLYNKEERAEQEEIKR